MQKSPSDVWFNTCLVLYLLTVSAVGLMIVHLLLKFGFDNALLSNRQESGLILTCIVLLVGSDQASGKFRRAFDEEHFFDQSAKASLKTVMQKQSCIFLSKSRCQIHPSKTSCLDCPDRICGLSNARL
jgi:hypothetical protein